MRQLVVALPILVIAGTTACQQGPRALEGTAEEGTTSLLVIDTAGESFEAKPGADLGFRIELPTSHPVLIFALKDNGALGVVKFPEKLGGAAVATKIPNHDGTVTLGLLSTCDCNDDGDATEQTPSENPLEQIDSDEDGANDAADADDDNDGVFDGDDGDDDGEQGADSENDLDGDDDGTPDACEHDESLQGQDGTNDDGQEEPAGDDNAEQQDGEQQDGEQQDGEDRPAEEGGDNTQDGGDNTQDGGEGTQDGGEGTGDNTEDGGEGTGDDCADDGTAEEGQEGTGDNAEEPREEECTGDNCP